MVVVEDAESVPVGECGDQQIHGREPVVSDACELCLGVEGTPLGRLVEAVLGEGEELGEELIVVVGDTNRVAGFEEDGQTRRDAPGLDAVGELLRAFIR